MIGLVQVSRVSAGNETSGLGDLIVPRLPARRATRDPRIRDKLVSRLEAFLVVGRSKGRGTAGGYDQKPREFSRVHWELPRDTRN
jgi:hypothetical protein